MSDSNEREPLLGTAPIKGLLSIFLILITLASSIVAVALFVITLILAPTPEDFAGPIAGGRKGDIRFGVTWGTTAVLVAVFCQAIRRLFLKR
jgi:hypothetical protein